MSKITFAHRNLADAGTVAASSEVKSLPAAFLQDPDITKVWRSLNVHSASLVVDIGQAAECGVVMLANANVSTIATIRIEAAASAAFTTLLFDSGTGTVALATRNGLVVSYFQPVAARYWRITITDLLVSYIEAGRLFLGAWRELRYNFKLPAKAVVDDPSASTRSYGGQISTDRRRQTLGVELDLNLIEQEALEYWPDIVWWCGSAGDLLMTLDRDRPNPTDVSIWGLLQQPLQLPTQVAFNLFTCSFRLMERI